MGLSSSEENDMETWYNKGLVLTELGKYDDALTYFDKIISIDPDDIRACNMKGVSLAKLGKYDDAITYFDKIISIDPNDENGWYGKCKTLAQLGKYDDAIKCFDKATAMEHDRYRKIYDLIKKQEQELDLKSMIVLDPNLANMWNDKGIALVKLGKYIKAIECYDKAIIVNPNHASAWFNKGIAIDAFSLIHVDQDSMDSKINWARGVLHAKAFMCFQKAKELEPDRY